MTCDAWEPGLRADSALIRLVAGACQQCCLGANVWMCECVCVVKVFSMSLHHTALQHSHNMCNIEMNENRYNDGHKLSIRSNKLYECV